MIEGLSQEIEGALAVLAFPGEVPGLYEPIKYTLANGGKRIRPLLCLLGAEFCGGHSQKVLNQALGVEVFHNFTLVHDDIMDKAPIRRGVDSVYKKWNSNTAILSGDVMFAMAVDLISKCDKDRLPVVLSSFLDAAVRVCEGQQMDMDFERRKDVSMADYLRMVELKTAYLLAASIKIGAETAGAGEDLSRGLFSFMMKAGTAFQLMDDYLDAFGSPEKFGKKDGGDIVAGKKTYLYVKAMEDASPEDRAALMDIYDENRQRGEAEISVVKDIFKRSGASSALRETSDGMLREAMGSLNGLEGQEDVKSELITLTQQLINREK